jgi:hypothetical protein
VEALAEALPKFVVVLGQIGQRAPCCVIMILNDKRRSVNHLFGVVRREVGVLSQRGAALVQQGRRKVV